MTTRMGLVLVMGLASACGGGPGRSPATPMAPLQVGGTYQIVKMITENTCDGTLTPATVVGSVTHTPGAAAFSLSDSFTLFSGSVQSNGLFTITPQVTAPGHTGAPATATFESGRFTATGFEAQVRLDINGPLGTPPFPACRVSETWRATKVGSPNVIPGP